MSQRRRRCGPLVLAMIVLALSGCSSSGTSALPTTVDSKCAAKENGALCIQVIKNGAVVGDVFGYVSYSGSFLRGKTWRIVLSRYSCDPGTSSRPACRPSASYLGRIHRGQGMASTYCKTANGATITAPPGCHNVFWTEVATHGDWSGYFTVDKPVRYPTRTWLCITEQVRNAGSWRLVTSTTPVRDCSHIA